MMMKDEMQKTLRMEGRNRIKLKMNIYGTRRVSGMVKMAVFWVIASCSLV
jgi:hypothetical protein